MKLSTRTRYGLRIMLDVAENGLSGPVTMRDISARQQISPKYVEKLSRELKKAGYLNSKLGIHGGYLLSKPSEKISVGDIVKVMEGGLELVDCWLRDGACPRHSDCLACSMWGKISSMLTDTLHGVTLADLLRNGEEVRDAASDFIEWY